MGHHDANTARCILQGGATTWTDLLRRMVLAPNGLRALQLVMRYLLDVSDHVVLNDLAELAGRELGPEAKDATMTGAQRLIEEGIQLGKQEGIQLGKQEGIQLGELRGRQQMLMNVLRLRFGDEVTAEVERRVGAASAEQFEAWVERMLSAVTLGELLDA